MSQAANRPPPALLTGRIEFLAAAKRLVSDTRYNASLLSQALDGRVFGDASFADAVKEFLLLQRNARLRVLVVQPQQAARGPNALVDLGRLLTSRVEFREFAPDKPTPRDELLIGDGRLVLERNAADALESRLIRDDALTARERQRRFDALWDHAVPCIELRRQSI